MTDYEKEMAALRRGIDLARPTVSELLDDETPLSEYSLGLHGERRPPRHSKRQALFKGEVRRYLERCFSHEELEAGDIDWESDWTTNISDHHLPICHPFPIGANIISNLWGVPGNRPRGSIVLSDSGIPLNNFLFKRGFRLHEHQLNVIPNRDRHKIVYNNDLIESFPLLEHARDQGLPASDHDFVEKMEGELLDAVDHHGLRGGMDQITRINHRLWPRVFEESLREDVPDIFYVPNEEICAGILMQLLSDSTNIFTRLLCEQPLRESVTRRFNGIYGCWEEEGEHGTHFFWAIDRKGVALRLRIDGGFLVNEKAGYRLELNADAIQQALQRREIYPGLFLVYGLCIFHCLMKPLVGFGSLNYLKAMQEAWFSILQPIDPDEADLAMSVDTTGSIFGPVVTWESVPGGVRELHLLDILWRGGLTGSYLERLRRLPFSQVILPALPDIYKLCVQPEDREVIGVTGAELMARHCDWLP